MTAISMSSAAVLIKAARGIIKSHMGKHHLLSGLKRRVVETTLKGIGMPDTKLLGQDRRNILFPR